MKTLYEKITKGLDQSFVCFEGHDFSQVPYHHHKEIEVTYIHKGYGQRCIGHKIEPFQAGELAIAGSMLAHTWKPADDCLPHQDQHSFVLQFHPDVFGKDFWQSPEQKDLLAFIKKSQAGLITKSIEPSVCLEHYQNILHSEGIQRTLHFISFLNALTELDWEEPISKVLHEENALTQKGAPTIEKVVNHMLQHYPEEIRQPDMAKLSSMSISHFSRFFKQSTGHSFSEYLNLIRVDQACQRLQHKQHSISQVAFDVGYRNLSQFNLAFKKQCGITPKEYRRRSQLH